ncbi:MAG: hypothetical protein AAGC46_09090 [Solirubrobacteraceae bacterium]|nr:hypothetical protein [Patulibacter sp.]
MSLLHHAVSPISALAADTPAQGGGAPLGQLAIISIVLTTLTVLVLRLFYAYRAGGAPRFRAFTGRVEKLVGLPGWAAVPGAGAVIAATIIILGATWDIGLHIDKGRDNGPLGTVAHYPLLLGLYAGFVFGILAIGMGPRNPKRTSSVAFHVAGLGYVPAAALLMVAGGTFGMAAFPLDDVWHRIFGQDVTLWGPTHVMIIGGTLTVGLGGVLLLIEGARAAGRDPFRGKGLIRRPLPALLAGVCLYLWAATTHEFNWGVPQYREVWQPLLLAFGSGQAFVLARLLAGRGGALAAFAVWAPVQLFMSLVIGGPLHVTMPAAPLFIVEALVIEALALRGDPRRPTLYGAIAGVGVGTIGFAAEYGWSQLVMPLPWTPALLSEGVPIAILAGIAGGTLGALMAQALLGTLPAGRRPLWAAIAAAVLFVGLGYDAADTNAPAGRTATLTLSNVRLGHEPNHAGLHRIGDLSVRFSDTALEHDANWVYAMGWQGGGSYRNRLVQQADGSWRTTQPVPLDGKWKTMVRVHKGRTMLSVPIRYPADPAIGFTGFPERGTVTRAMVGDVTIMQLERKKDAPLWAWKPATMLVLSLNFLMAILMGAVCVRLGRMVGRPPTARAPRGLILAGTDAVTTTLGHVSRRAGVHAGTT